MRWRVQRIGFVKWKLHIGLKKPFSNIISLFPILFKYQLLLIQISFTIVDIEIQIYTKRALIPLLFLPSKCRFFLIDALDKQYF